MRSPRRCNGKCTQMFGEQGVKAPDGNRVHFDKIMRMLGMVLGLDDPDAAYVHRVGRAWAGFRCRRKLLAQRGACCNDFSIDAELSLGFAIPVLDLEAWINNRAFF